MTKKLLICSVLITTFGPQSAFSTKKTGTRINRHYRKLINLHKLYQPQKLHLREYTVDEDIICTVWDGTKQILGTDDWPAQVADGPGEVRQVNFPSGALPALAKFTDGNLGLTFEPNNERGVNAYVRYKNKESTLTELKFTYDGTKQSGGKPHFDIVPASEVLDNPDLIEALQELLSTYARIGESQLLVFSKDGTYEISTDWSTSRLQ